jgi:hypothetical protein
MKVLFTPMTAMTRSLDLYDIDWSLSVTGKDAHGDTYVNLGM